MENPDVVNSYENTEKLAEKFPTIYPTPIESQMEKKIQNRLLTGFENWNRGFAAWKAWGEILYTPASLYNVHAVHLTLSEYQNAMNATLRANDIQMGNFRHMVVVDDWTAIHYDITTINRATGFSVPGSVMEFVHFGDLGADLGTRVIEGWAGTKGADYAGLSYFQTPEERMAQKAMMDAIAMTEIPDTDELETKYPVKNPVSIRTEEGQRIRQRILADFDHFNLGAEAWTAWADDYYTEDVLYYDDDHLLSLSEMKNRTLHDAEFAEMKRVYFESMLISGSWAAIHYRIVVQNKENGIKEAGSRMQFLHFSQQNGDMYVDKCWSK